MAQSVQVLADDAADLADAYITLLVHAGIAASDVICSARLGEHSQGERHTDAITLLAKVSQDLSRDLEALLRVKTKAGYSHQPATTDEVKRAERAARRLIDAMSEIPRH